MLRKSFVAAIFALFSNFTSAAAGGSGLHHIKQVTIKETGYVLVVLDSAHSNPEGCERSDIAAIPANHVARDQMLSVVLTAYGMGKRVSFWLSGCYERYNTTYPVAMTVSVMD